MTATQNTAYPQDALTTYDIIGDIHGQIAMLEDLLEQLEYQHNGAHYYKANHQVIFVGDLIDKGDYPAEVLQLVRAMVDSGNAMMVIGNHEINWIKDAAEYAHDTQAFIQATNKHYDRRDIIAAYENNTDDLIDVFHWLRRQPLFIDLPALRAVHACWNQDAIDVLHNAGIRCMDDKALAAYNDTYSDLYLAMDLVVSGCFHQFPETISPHQQFRSIRSRIRWFPFGKVDVNPFDIQPLVVNHPAYPADAAPVFFGHYALSGKPDLLADNIAGVDFSAAYGGKLTAYRLRAGEPLHRQNFFSSRSGSHAG